MSEVLDVPTFTTVPLVELLTDIRNGLVVDQEKESPGIPITRIETISKGTVDMDRVRYVRDTAGKNLDNFWLKTGDILFSHINSDLHLGKTAIVSSDAPLLHGMNLLRLRVDSNRLRPKYLHHWLDYCRRTGVFMAIAQHAVNQSSLNQKKITSLEVPLRAVGEQDEIVAELEKQFSRLDEAVTNLQRVKANLKRYKASVLKAAVEGRLVETEATLARREGRTFETGEQLLQRILEERRAKWRGKGRYKEPVAQTAEFTIAVTDGWTSATVDQLASVQLGKMLDKQKHKAGEPYRYLRNINVRWGTFDVSDVFEMNFESDELERFSVRAGDVLVCEGGEPARAAVWRAKQTDMKYQKALHRVRFDGAYLPDLIVIALEHLAKSGALDELYGGSTIKHFTRETFVKLVLPVPPAAEQARIVAEVDRHLSIIREVEVEVEANLQRAQALRQATLAKAFANT